MPLVMQGQGLTTSLLSIVARDFNTFISKTVSLFCLIIIENAEATFREIQFFSY